MRPTVFRKAVGIMMRKSHSCHAARAFNAGHGFEKGRGYSIVWTTDAFYSFASAFNCGPRCSKSRGVYSLVAYIATTH